MGFDSPKSLGKNETGSKAALPIFKDFIKNALFKEEFKSFNIPNGIYFASIDYDSGEKKNFGDKNVIIEAFKPEDMNNTKNNELFLNLNYDKLIKYRQFY